MIYPIVIKPEAEADLERAELWYNSQRDGLGNDFLLEVEKTLRIIQGTPFLFPRQLRDARLTSIDRFPYAIVYRVTRTQIRVLAVYHTRGDPQSWRGRI